MGATLVTVAVWLGGWVFAALMAVSAAIGQAELYALLRKAGSRPMLTLGIAVGACASLASLVPFAVAGLVAGTILMLVSTLYRKSSETPLHDVAGTLMGVAYPAALMGTVVWLRTSDAAWLGADGAFWLTVALFFCVWGADTFAYVAGRALGKRPLFPRVSPKKTWEGAVGGAGGAFVLAAGFKLGPLADILAWPDIAVMAFACGLVAPFGDLAESLFKALHRHQGLRRLASRPRRHAGPHRRGRRGDPARGAVPGRGVRALRLGIGDWGLGIGDWGLEGRRHFCSAGERVPGSAFRENASGLPTAPRPTAFVGARRRRAPARARRPPRDAATAVGRVRRRPGSPSAGFAVGRVRRRPCPPSAVSAVGRVRRRPGSPSARGATHGWHGRRVTFPPRTRDPMLGIRSGHTPRPRGYGYEPRFYDPDEDARRRRQLAFVKPSERRSRKTKQPAFIAVGLGLVLAFFLYVNIEVISERVLSFGSFFFGG